MAPTCTRVPPDRWRRAVAPRPSEPLARWRGSSWSGSGRLRESRASPGRSLLRAPQHPVLSPQFRTRKQHTAGLRGDASLEPGRASSRFPPTRVCSPYVLIATKNRGATSAREDGFAALHPRSGIPCALIAADGLSRGRCRRVARSVRGRPGRAAALARRLRAATRRGGEARSSRARRRRPHADASGRRAARRARPHDEKGRPLAPFDAWGHDHVWWLDRMVRTSRPLVERMTLIWHDWFATSNNGVGSQRLMLNQNQLFRGHAPRLVPDLLLDVTKDPAMLLWLNGSDNSKGAPNENYAREMMELFTLGAGPRLHGARRPRAGACAHRLPERLERERGASTSASTHERHDAGAKTIFRQRGPLRLEGLVPPLRHTSDHPRSSSRSSGATSSPTRPGPRDAARARAALRRDGYEVRPVVAAILHHPPSTTGRGMVKPPVVYNAGLLRRIGRGIDTDRLGVARLDGGQQLFIRPTSPAGTTRAGSTPRPGADAGGSPSTRSTARRSIPGMPTSPTTPGSSSTTHRRFWHNPPLGRRHPPRAAHVRAPGARRRRGRSWKREQYP